MCVPHVTAPLGAIAHSRSKSQRLWTPLQYACDLNRPDCVRALLVGGASLETVNMVSEQTRTSHPSRIRSLSESRLAERSNCTPRGFGGRNCRLHGRSFDARRGRARRDNLGADRDGGRVRDVNPSASEKARRFGAASRSRRVHAVANCAGRARLSL